MEKVSMLELFKRRIKPKLDEFLAGLKAVYGDLGPYHEGYADGFESATNLIEAELILEDRYEKVV